MSLYNLINGVKPAAFLVLPMLGKHAEEYPRFRDCFIGDDEHPEYAGHIIVYTRTGGGNRESYISENQEMRRMPSFVADYDDSFDSTFACWVFKVPDEWRSDFDVLMAGKPWMFSAAYRERLKQFYPKLAEKFDDLLKEPSEPLPA